MVQSIELQVQNKTIIECLLVILPSVSSIKYWYHNDYMN